MNEIKKSKILIYLLSILQFQGFIGPVLFVFYTSYMGLNVSEYLFCDSLLFFIMAIVEIPSGMIADHLGRKKVLIFSKAAILFAMMILLTVRSFSGAITVAIIYGIFGALESGIVNSVLYELFEKHDDLEEYEYITAKSGGVGFVISIFYSVAAGYLAKVNIALPVVFDFLVGLLSLFAVAILLIDTKANQRTLKTLTLPHKKEVFNVLPILLLASLTMSIVRISYSFYQPIYENLGIDKYWLGIIAACYSIMASISSFLYSKVRNRMNTWTFIWLLILLQMISTTGMAYIGSFAVIIIIFIQQFQRGLLYPFMYMQVNGYIDSSGGQRVTLMSIMYFLTTITSALFLYLTSKVIEFNNLTITLKLFAIVANALTILFFAIFYVLDKKVLITNYT